jgi:hypothetical protein
LKLNVRGSNSQLISQFGQAYRVLNRLSRQASGRPLWLPALAVQAWLPRFRRCNSDD